MANNSTSITIIGAGIIGLTTAIELQKAGYAIKLIAAEPPLQSNSMNAGAVWTPYLSAPADRVAHWGHRSFLRYKEAAQNSATGAYFVWLDTYLRHPILPDWIHLLPKDHWKVLGSDDVPAMYKGGFRMYVPMIEPPVYLDFLFKQFLEGGGQFTQKKLESLEETPGGWLINCTGLGAQTFTPDPSVYPVKGQIIMLEKRDGIPYYVDDEFPETLSYVFPRSDGIIVGGSAEPNVFNLNLDKNLLKEIIKRSNAILPQLADLKILRQWSGFRPARPEIRLEKESHRSIIHNYGHGGAGFTLAWGCAENVLQILRT